MKAYQKSLRYEIEVRIKTHTGREARSLNIIQRTALLAFSIWRRPRKKKWR